LEDTKRRRLSAILELERELSLEELDADMDWPDHYRPALQRLYDLCFAHGISTFLSPPQSFAYEEAAMRASSPANILNSLVVLVSECSTLLCGYLSLQDAAALGCCGSQFAAARPESRVPLHLRRSHEMLPQGPLPQGLLAPRPKFANYYKSYMNAIHPSIPAALLALEPTSSLSDYLISYRLITSAGGIVVAGQCAHPTMFACCRSVGCPTFALITFPRQSGRGTVNF
jgi:hypothetical protein